MSDYNYPCSTKTVAVVGHDDHTVQVPKTVVLTSKICVVFKEIKRKCNVLMYDLKIFGAFDSNGDLVGHTFFLKR